MFAGSQRRIHLDCTIPLDYHPASFSQHRAAATAAACSGFNNWNA